MLVRRLPLQWPNMLTAATCHRGQASRGVDREPACEKANLSEKTAPDVESGWVLVGDDMPGWTDFEEDLDEEDIDPDRVVYLAAQGGQEQPPSRCCELAHSAQGDFPDGTFCELELLGDDDDEEEALSDFEIVPLEVEAEPDSDPFEFVGVDVGEEDEAADASLGMYRPGDDTRDTCMPPVDKKVQSPFFEALVDSGPRDQNDEEQRVDGEFAGVGTLDPINRLIIITEMMERTTFEEIDQER